MRILAQRFFDLVSLVAPAVVLALLPKCPVCFAAYVALATGLGISVAAAANLRVLLILVCAGVLLLLVRKQIRRLTA